jgi:hypothetical protein
MARARSFVNATWRPTPAQALHARSDDVSDVSCARVPALSQQEWYKTYDLIKLVHSLFGEKIRRTLWCRAS